MMTQTTAYDDLTNNDLIDCVEQGADPYPVLHIGDTVIWPSREQLVAIRDAIQGYLNAHPAPFTPEEVEKIAAGIEAEDRAEAQAISEYLDAHPLIPAPLGGLAATQHEKIAEVPEYTDAEIQEMF